MKKVLFKVGLLLFVLVFTLALFKGRSNYLEAVFMATNSEGTDLAISIEMQRYGFDLDWNEEPTILDYCYSGIFY
jgi:hypothetical protein